MVFPMSKAPVTLALLIALWPLVPQTSRPQRESSMNPKVADEAGFNVIGIAERTTNAKEMAGEGIIGKQWGHFIQDNVLGQIPNKADTSIIAVITDYAS